MKSVKKSFRKTEFALLIVGLLLLFAMIFINIFFLEENKAKLSIENRHGDILQRGQYASEQQNSNESQALKEAWQSINVSYVFGGYLLGFLAFTISYELFFLLEPNPKTRKWGYLLLTNLKLVIIGGLFYYVRLTGIPATSLVIGFIACETLAVFVLLFNAYRSNNILKVSKAKTDSSN